MRRPAQTGVEPQTVSTPSSDSAPPVDSDWSSAPTAPAVSAPSFTRVAPRTRVMNATRTTSSARRNSCTPRRTCDRCIAVCHWISTHRHSCAGLAPPPVRSRWSAAMDDLAVRLGIDPIDLRLRNEPDRDQSENLPFSTRRLTHCFRHGATTFGWSRRNPTPLSLATATNSSASAPLLRPTIPLRSPCAVTARLNADGTADVETAHQRYGPRSRYTAMTQVAARRCPRFAHPPNPILAGRQSLTRGARARRLARWPALAPPSRHCRHHAS